MASAMFGSVRDAPQIRVHCEETPAGTVHVYRRRSAGDRLSLYRFSSPQFDARLVPKNTFLIYGH